MRLDNPDSVFFEPFMLENTVRVAKENALSTDMDQFRHFTRHPLCGAVVARHKVALRRVFRHFANCDEGESLNRNALHQMARSCGWLSKTVTIDTLNDIFRRVQRTMPGDSSSFGAGVAAASTNMSSPLMRGSPHHHHVAGGDVIDLSEWIECISAVATFTFPDPFRPLHQKLAALTALLAAREPGAATEEP